MTTREKELEVENLRLREANRRLQATESVLERVKLIIALRTRISFLENGIKDHHDAVGNDRCWLNNKKLYALIGIEWESCSLPQREEFLHNCKIYYDEEISSL